MDLTLKESMLKQSLPVDNYIKHFKITWKIENFLHSNLHGVLLKSSIFYLENFTFWFLALEPQFKNETALLYLHRVLKDKGTQKVPLNFRLGLQQGTEEIWFPETHAEFQAGAFKSETCKSHYFINSQIVVLCQIMVVEDIFFVTELNENSSKLSFMNDVYNLHKTEYLSDFILDVGGTFLKTHKAILAERSLFLRNLFSRQADDFSYLKLLDVDLKEVKNILAYMYSGDFYAWCIHSHMKLAAYDFIVKFHVVPLKDLLDPIKINLVSECVKSTVENYWKIKSFNGINANKVLKTSTFKTPLGFVQFKHNRTSKKSDTMSILIEPVCRIKTLVAIHIEFSALDSNKKKFHLQTFTAIRNPKKVFKMSFSIKQKPLLRKKLQLLLEEDLTVSCLIKSSDYKTKNKILHVHENKVNRNIQFLCFTSMLESANFSDFTIFAGDKTFRVHKAILAARSTFFRQLFINYKENSISLYDLRPSTLKALLSYVYSGQISLDIETGLELQKVSDKYLVTHLTHVLYDFYLSKCDQDNVCELLLKANAWEVENVKNMAFNFLLQILI